MWENIKNNGLVVRMKKSAGHFTIPEAPAILTADKLLNMQNWVYKEFITDCESNASLVINLGKNPVVEQDFINRNTSRTLSYVNQSCIIEDILIRAYSDMFDTINKHIDNAVKPDLTEIEKRSAEHKDVADFRNTVSAHTVYGSPLKKDNASLELSSLMSILGSSFTDKDTRSFALGYTSSRLIGQDPSRTIPGVGLKELHEKMIEHYQRWEKMFVEPLRDVSLALPIDAEDRIVMGPGQATIESDTKVFKQ